MKLNDWLELLPAGLGLFVVVIAAGVLGLFRSLALSKQSYNDTLDSYKRQVETLEHENAILRKSIDMYKNVSTGNPANDIFDKRP